MQLVKYNPLRDLRRIEHDLDRFWGTDWGLLPAVTESTPIDMYEEEGKLVTEMPLPAFTKEEIKVTADKGVLEISAEHKEKEEQKGKRRYYMRESSNHYLRRVPLPDGVNTDQTEASFSNGVLKVTMPTQPKAKSKTIVVK